MPTRIAAKKTREIMASRAFHFISITYLFVGGLPSSLSPSLCFSLRLDLFSSIFFIILFISIHVDHYLISLKQNYRHHLLLIIFKSSIFYHFFKIFFGYYPYV